MTSPIDGEYGDWHGADAVATRPELSRNHGEFYASLQGLSLVEQDTAFKQAALQNIREYPLKYLANLGCNIGRMLFNYPYSYTPQKPSTFLYLVPNMFLVVGAFVAACLLAENFRQIRLDIAAVAALLVTAMGISALVSGYARQFTILVPWVLVLIAQSGGLFLERRSRAAVDRDANGRMAARPRCDSPTALKYQPTADRSTT